MGITGPAALRRRKEHRSVFEVILNSGLTSEILDARFPQRCRSRDLENYVMRKEKPLILCINKSDLIPSRAAEKWKEILSKDFPTVHLSVKDRNGTSVLRRMIFQHCRFDPTPDDPLTLSICGYPNTGKSSLINILSGRNAAPVSPLAGYTRALRKVKISP